MLSLVPPDWGPQLHSDSGSVTRTHTGPNAIGFTAKAHYAIVMLTPQPERIMTLNSDRRRPFRAPAGTLEFVPADAELFAEWRFPKENFLFAFSPERMKQVSIAEYGDENIAFALPFAGQIDLEAQRISRLFEAEFRHLRNGSVNELYLESLLTVFSTHLLRKYSGPQLKVQRLVLGGLTARSMREVDGFIRANLARRINLSELAAVADLSPSHFTRAFRQTTGQPPYRYITTLRLHLVKELTGKDTLTLGEIADKAGFGTHSQMTAIMQRYWGITPSAMRRGRRR